MVEEVPVVPAPVTTEEKRAARKVNKVVEKVEAGMTEMPPTPAAPAEEVKMLVEDVTLEAEGKAPITQQMFDRAKSLADEIEKSPVAQKVREQVKMAADQIDGSKIAGDVRKAAQDARTTFEKSPITAALHKLLLASIGAVAMAQEEIEDLINRLVERGEIAEADGKRMLKDVFEQRRKAMDKAQAVASEMAEAPKRVADDVEKRVEGVLSRMNIPSKDEIEALSAKITALTRKVDELKKPQ